MMEFIRAPDDSFAGYLQEDSDLEFSDCSDGVSSDEGEGGGGEGRLLDGMKLCARLQPAGQRESGGGGGRGESSEDEFERDMECELMGLLETLASPDVLAATAASRRGRGPVAPKSPSKRVKAVTGLHPQTPVGGPSSSSGGPSSSSGGPSSSSGGPSSSGGGPSCSGRGPSSSSGGPSCSREVGGEEGSEQDPLDQAAACYDNVYFETSSSEEEEEEGGGDKTKAKKRKQKKKQGQQCRRLTDEELFYDPHMDEEDEQWVKRQRMAYHNVKVSQQLKEEKKQRKADAHTPLLPREGGKQGEGDGRGDRGGGEDTGGRKASEEGGGRGKKKDFAAIPKSDALLSCPACMTTLCIDCQQHAVYAHQFRAMFVMNCRIQRDEVLKYVPKLTKKERQKQKWKGKRREGEGGSVVVGEGVGEEERRGVGEGGEGEGGDGEDYYSVHCAECNTEVAVFDSDEVFHFFNVLASASS